MNVFQPFVLGEKIRSSRMSKKLTQQQLAEIVDISRTYICSIECGKAVPSISLLIRFAKALDVSTDCLLDIDPSTASLSQSETLLKDCSNDEKSILIDNMKNLKNLITQYNLTKKK